MLRGYVCKRAPTRVGRFYSRSLGGTCERVVFTTRFDRDDLTTRLSYDLTMQTKRVFTIDDVGMRRRRREERHRHDYGFVSVWTPEPEQSETLLRG